MQAKNMREALEREIEKQCCDYFWHLGLFFWKQPQSGYFDASIKRFKKHRSPYVRNGVPDIMIIYNGHFYGVEFKTKTGRQSPHQKEFERLVKESGGSYFICRSLEDAKVIFNTIKNSG